MAAQDGDSMAAEAPFELSMLPPGNSPSIALLPSNAFAVGSATFVLNHPAFGGRLSVQQYLAREQHLASQSATRNAGITWWILTDTSRPVNQRPILAACETYRKAAYVARAGADGTVEEVTMHGVGSVYCRPEFQRRGYAARMMDELSRVLGAGFDQRSGQRAAGSVLYSDIGREFYTRRGWRPYASAHIELPAVGRQSGNPWSGEIPDTENIFCMILPALCERDSRMLRDMLVRERRREGQAGRTQVALVPDLQTMQWHHAREEFIAEEVVGRPLPRSKGAIAMRGDYEVWCIWCRVWGDTDAENKLYILRTVVAKEGRLVQAGDEGVDENVVIELLKGCLEAAQNEAADWGMAKVCAWNPGTWAVDAARALDESTTVVEREESSIASLRWFGSEEVVWHAIERFGWC